MTLNDASATPQGKEAANEPSTNSAARPLGHLELTDLRQQWPGEVKDFTPWLGKEGLPLLGKTIGGELSLVPDSKRFGAFNADIVAQLDGDEDHRVVIENQLDETDHKHLGQLVTYASGLGARTAICIAKEFRPEHRQALDWLNSGMQGDVSFYGVEIQLVKIGESLPAPLFRIVSSPNTLARTIKEAQRGELTTRRLDYQQFWQELVDYMRSKKTILPLSAPRPQHYFSIPLGRSNIHLSLNI